MPTEDNVTLPFVTNIKGLNVLDLGIPRSLRTLFSTKTKALSPFARLFLRSRCGVTLPPGIKATQIRDYLQFVPITRIDNEMFLDRCRRYVIFMSSDCVSLLYDDQGNETKPPERPQPVAPVETKEKASDQMVYRPEFENTLSTATVLGGPIVPNLGQVVVPEGEAVNG